VSLIYEFPQVLPGQRLTAFEQNAFRGLVADAVLGDTHGLLRNILPGGTTAWFSSRSAGIGPPAAFTDHAHKDGHDGGYDNYGLTGPD